MRRARTYIGLKPRLIQLHGYTPEPTSMLLEKTPVASKINKEQLNILPRMFNRKIALCARVAIKKNSFSVFSEAFQIDLRPSTQPPLGKAVLQGRTGLTFSMVTAPPQAIPPRPCGRNSL